MKVLLVAHEKSNLLDALINYLESEVIEYALSDSLENVENDITNIIYINEENDSGDLAKIYKRNIVVISAKKVVVKNAKSVINYVVTPLVNDQNVYSEVQEEYLFRNGIYRTILKIIGDLLINVNDYDGLVYDLSEIKSKPDEWIFNFESINETYHWLSNKNRNLPDNCVQKVISFYSDKVYNDSLNEINYLSDKLLNIKKKKNIIDIFICNKEEIENYHNNYFFKILFKNISDTYSIYLVDKDELMNNDLSIYNRLRDGIIVYNDCVYRDTYDDEKSLGVVDCKKETIEEYDKYFDYVLEKYGHKVNMESDVDEFFR